VVCSECPHWECSILTLKRGQELRSALKLTAIVFLVAMMSVGTTGADEASIKHLNAGAADKVFYCIDEALGGRILLHGAFLGDFGKVTCLAGQARDLVVKNMEAQGFRALSNEKWTLLVPDDLFTGGRGFKVPWNKLKVDVDVVEAAEGTQEKLSEQNVAFLKEQLTSKTRLIPVYPDTDAVPADVANVHLRYTLYVYKNKDGTISIAAVLHEGEDFTTLGTFGRVIYGEIVAGKVQLRWDSPLVFVASVALQDIDGDGNNEIIVRGTLGFGAHGPGLDALAVFNHEGRELTRLEENCKWMNGTELRSAQDRICPIVGSDVNLQVTEKGPIISATDTPGHGGAIYVFQDGHFVLDRSNVKKLYRRSR
jgi:hypothetical protein